MTRFLHPEWIAPIAVAGAVLAACVIAAAAQAGARRRRLLGAAPRFPGISRDALLLAALAAIGLAAVGPRMGTRLEPVPAGGVDVVMLLDVSRSMDARDVAPSRLERARREATRLLGALEPQDRAALAAFAAHGVLLTPLTSDRAALEEMLAAVDGLLFRDRSSDLGDGLHAARGAFEEASARPRVIVLLSDGEDPSRVPLDEAIAATARAGIRVLGAAVGSESGATIPAPDLPLRDGRGEIVRSRRDADRLRILAEATGGTLLATDGFGALALDEAVRAVRRDAGDGGPSGTVRPVPAVPVKPLAALALALLLAELLLEAGHRLPARGAARRLAESTLLGVSLLLLPAAAGGADEPGAPEVEVARLEALVAASPGDPALLVRLGVARARAGRAPEAERAFLAAALVTRDASTAALAYFDLGVTALGRGDLESARDAFFDALALRPEDDEARFNLEWTLAALRETAPPPSDPGPDGGARPAPEPGAPDPTARAGDSAERPGEPAPGTRGEESAREGETTEPREGAPAASAAPEAPDLDAAEVARWLDAVQDDPARSLRDGARRAGRGERAARAPDW